MLGVLFYGLGVGSFLEPNKFFFLGGRWRYRGDPELSPEGELSVRFAAALFLCFGVLLTSGLLPAILS